MKRTWRGPAALALALSLSLTGCAKKTGEDFTTRDAEIYVEGVIQENYLGQASPEYMELVDIDEDDVQELYEQGLEVDATYFAYMYDIDDPSDELLEEIRDLYKEIYSHVKYEVVSAAQQEDGSFSVKVNVYPIDIFQLVYAAWDNRVSEFYEKYPADVLNTMTTRQYAAVNEEWARLVLDLFDEMLEEIGNMTVRSISVQLEKDSEGYYVFNDDDFDRLNELIVDYTSVTTVSKET